MSRLMIAALLAAAVPASDALAQYGSYRGSKYSGGFGAAPFGQRRQSRVRHHTFVTPGLYNPLNYGILGYGGGVFGSPYVYGGGFVDPYVGGGLGYPLLPQRTIGVTGGAIYNPGVASFGYSTNTGFGGLGYSRFGTATLGPSVFGPPVGGVATVGSYGYGYTPGLMTPGFADPYVLPQAPVTPTQSYYTDDADTARRLREMLRSGDAGTVRQPYRAARPIVSEPAQKARSLRFEQQGDRHFADQSYLKAYTFYKDAVDAAGDRTEPRAKLVVTYAAISQYDKAVRELKDLLSIDPTYPRHFLSLDSIFGDQQVSKEGVKTRVAEWTAGNVSDPERLLLLAALMYFDGDIDRSRQLFETVQLYEDLAPLVSAFRRSDTLTVPPVIGPPVEQPGPPPLAPGEVLVPGSEKVVEPPALPPLGDGVTLDVPEEPILVPPLPED